MQARLGSGDVITDRMLIANPVETSMGVHTTLLLSLFGRLRFLQPLSCRTTESWPSTVDLLSLVLRSMIRSSLRIVVIDYLVSKAERLWQYVLCSDWRHTAIAT
jgi:hypothetical protein